MPSNTTEPQLRLKRLGIDSYQENIVFMQADCPVCKSEGFKAQTRVVVGLNGKSIIATLNVIHYELLSATEVALSEIAFTRLGAEEGELISIRHLEPLNSMAYVRSKIYGHKLSEDAYFSIINDVSHGKYSDVQMAAFISACSGKGRMEIDEITSLTKAMINSGNTLHWGDRDIVDKHCIGGLPGNRTSPIVVSILAAAGLYMAKTSSRAITSPAGTADVMEVMTNVDLSTEEIRDIVNQEGACLVWGGKVSLSPADDILIKVERALDIDSESQLIASVLSKKAAAGSSFVLLEIPVGETVKVRSWEDAEELQKAFERVAENINLKIEILLTDGSQPVGCGIGPALEAMDVLAVLRNDENAPADLRKKALTLAGKILEAKHVTVQGNGFDYAGALLTEGKAFQKFMRICEKQGGFKEPELAPYQRTYYAVSAGGVMAINNRKLSMAAKLAGAPLDKRAGLRIHMHLGDTISAKQALMTVYAESEGILNYVFDYLAKHPDLIRVENGAA